jgi:hypothetical protein
MAANGVLDFQSTNKLIFRGANANVVIDTQNLSLGVGHQGEGAITSNLFVTGNAELTSDTGSATIVPTELRLSSSTTNAADWDTTNPYARLAFHTEDITGDAPGVMASIGAVASSADGGENTRLAFFTAEPHLERMCVDRYGNVGINTPNPRTGLHLSLDAIGTVANKFSSPGLTFTALNNSTSDMRGGSIWSQWGNPQYGLAFRGVSSGDTFPYLADPAMFVTTDKVGIMTVSPLCKLHINQAGDLDNGSTLNLDGKENAAICMQKGGTGAYPTAMWLMGINGNYNLHFWYDSSGANSAVSKGYLKQSNDVTNIDFTGQHRNFIDGIPTANYTDFEGLIVSANKNKYFDIDENITTGANAIKISQSLPLVSLSNVVRDKACFGVISGSEDPDSREYVQGSFVSVVQKQRGDRRAFINSLGEGGIWVTNTNGSLESGDYITTSTVKGYGQKQDSEFLANYTVAKITMDCDFDPVTQPVQVIKKDEDGENVLDEHSQIQWEDHPTETEKAYKIRYLDADGVETDEASAVHKAAFVGCTYHCG